MKLFKALAALSALIALIVGPPLLLITFIGSPLPTNFSLNGSLSDSDILRLVSLAAWALWLQVLWCIIVEIHSTVTAQPLSRTLGTFSFQQQMVRVLVGAVIALFVAGPSIAFAAASVADEAQIQTEKAVTQDVVPVDSPVEQNPVDYVVKSGDTLSQISLDFLGDANRYPEIFEASQQLDQAIPLVDPDLIYPGQEIDIPGLNDAGPSVPPTDPVSQSEVGPLSPRAVEHGVEIPPLIEITSNEQATTIEDSEIAPAWVLAAFTGAGALLAGAALIVLRQRRAMQARFRRPGRVVPKPEPEAARIERNLQSVGAASSEDVEWLHEVLLRLASAAQRDKTALPRLRAAVLNSETLTLHLVDGPPVQTTRTVPLEEIGPEPGSRQAPWPLLAAVGHGADGTVLLNLEGSTFSINGVPEKAESLARFIAAELACSPWSSLTSLDLIALATQVQGMTPERTTTYEESGTPAGLALSESLETIDRLNIYGVDAPTARAHQEDPDIWPSRALFVDAKLSGSAEVAELANLANTHGVQISTVIITTGELSPAVAMHVDSEGTLRVEGLDFVLTAASLSVSEAEGCAALLSQADDCSDLPADFFNDGSGWQGYATVTGAVLPEYTISREVETLEPSTSVLSESDDLYTSLTPTTVDDLERLAPKVTESVRNEVSDSDPRLDADLEAWFDKRSPRPKLSVLGPVSLFAIGKKPHKRVAYYCELASYIALPENGAATQEMAANIGITNDRLRVDMGVLREWMGKDPATGEPFMPNARSSPAALQLAEARYQVPELLLDLDLFTRLRLRGMTRGSAGISDLRMALSLVRGEPFTNLREQGWSWLFEGSIRYDLNMQAAIADLGHILLTDALARQDVADAKTIVTMALAGSPQDEVLNIDLAAVISASGLSNEADLYLRELVFNRSDDGGAPLDLPDRSREVIEQIRRQSRAAI